MTEKRFAKSIIKLWRAKQTLKITLPKLHKLHQKKNVDAAVWNPVVHKNNAALAAHREALRELAVL